MTDQPLPGMPKPAPQQRQIEPPFKVQILWADTDAPADEIDGVIAYSWDEGGLTFVTSDQAVSRVPNGQFRMFCIEEDR